MLEEFKRYCALQRDQIPLASLLIYLKRKGGWVQLNKIWKDLGPTSGGPFWNQTTMINKLKKLDKLGVINIERRILPSSRVEEKKKTNTFCRINPASPVSERIYSMLRIEKDQDEKFSSELLEKPLDWLVSDIELTADAGFDPILERKLEVAMELIGEVFNLENSEVKDMIRQRLISRGLIEDE